MVAVMRLPVGLHPRSHGENVIDDGEARTGGGSSPLTRGKRPASDRGHGTAGLIPAHAGKTVPQGPRRSVSRAHPRSREENYAGASDVLRRNGSSPLTRGKRHACSARPVRDRLIPAHAGKTSSFSWLLRRSAAHPRSRGENSRVVMMVPFRGGSSPLTRGKRHHGADCNHLRGLIPAHAGKTHRTPTERMPRPAHPRSRGENGPHGIRLEQGRGSSPLTRGKLSRAIKVETLEGLIPAHAGKTING